jgi:hypothetical protein
MGFGKSPDTWRLTSLEADHYDTAVAENALDIENLGTLPTPHAIVNKVVVYSDENLAWDVVLFRQATFQVASEAVVAGGTGYTAPTDLVTVLGGIFGTAAVLSVDTVGGGGDILTASVSVVGDYTLVPNNPVSVTGGTGANATFDLTWSFSQPDSTPLEDHTLIDIVSFSAGDGAQIAAAGPFVYVASNLEMRFNADSQQALVGLIPRTAGGKAADPGGNVRIEISGPVL